MQVCINDEFYLHRVNSADSYETDLKNSEKFLKSEMFITEYVYMEKTNENWAYVNSRLY